MTMMSNTTHFTSQLSTQGMSCGLVILKRHWTSIKRGIFTLIKNLQSIITESIDLKKVLIESISTSPKMNDSFVVNNFSMLGVHLYY